MMNILKRLGVLVYAGILVCAGALLGLIALKVVTPELCVEGINAVTANIRFQAAAGCVGALLVLTGATAPFRLEKKLKKTRIVAFQNPDGEVTVSLSAVEEYIRKIAKRIPAIKEIKSRVDIGKKGIDVSIGISISAGANIPEITERIQMEVKNRVHGMLGIEEKVNIRTHISKITGSARDEAAAPAGSSEDAPIPFGGGE